VGALVAALLSNDWRPSELDNSMELVWWLGIRAVAVSLASLGYAVYPRLKPTERSGIDHDIVAFFGDVVSQPRAQLEERLEASAVIPSVPLVDQLWQVSSIVRAKYWAVRIALWTAAGGAIVVVLAVLIG
jgi:hypothetical protein